MGRPLAKRFFGNRNLGTSGTADNFIGGEGVGSYGTIVAGSGWTTAPTVTFSAPNIPGGVSVNGTAHYQALSFATTANGTGYAVGNILEVDTGTAATKARAPVASIVVIGTPGITNGGSLYDVSSPTIGDKITFTHANLSTPLRVRATAVTGSTITAIVVEQAGVWTGSGAAPTSMAGGVGGFTATTSGGPVDNNGSGLVLSFAGSNWGVYAFGTVSVAGDYTVFPSTGASGTLTSISPATGTGAKADITMGLLSIDVTEKGSGYTSVSDAAVSFSGSTGAAATAVLTVDTGRQGGGGNDTTNQENAIIIRAKTTSGGTVQIGDIQAQKGSHRYRVKTADGVAVCKLVATDSPLVNQAYMVATATGGTYYVTKLTAHRARLVAKTGDAALDGLTVKWTFGSPSATVVTIENA